MHRLNTKKKILKFVFNGDGINADLKVKQISRVKLDTLAGFLKITESFTVSYDTDTGNYHIYNENIQDAIIISANDCYLGRIRIVHWYEENEINRDKTYYFLDIDKAFNKIHSLLGVAR